MGLSYFIKGRLDVQVRDMNKLELCKDEIPLAPATFTFVSWHRLAAAGCSAEGARPEGTCGEAAR